MRYKRECFQSIYGPERAWFDFHGRMPHPRLHRAIKSPRVCVCVCVCVAVMVALLFNLRIAYSRRLGYASEAGSDTIQRQRGDAKDDLLCIWTSDG